MPKRRTVPGSLGLGPFLIVLLLLFGSLFALFLGRTVIQLATRLAISSAIVGVIYLVWHEVARKNPAFAMGSLGESTVILLFVAFMILVVSDPIASSVNMALIPNYQTLSFFGDPSLDAAEAGIAVGGLVAGLVVVCALILAVFRPRRK